MATYKIELKEYNDEVSKLQTKKPEIGEPTWNSGDFFTQRHKHRSWLFTFAISFSCLSFLLLVALLGFQTYWRARGSPSFEVISDTGIEVLAVSVLGQAFGVILVIARSVWSNDEFHLLSNEKRHK